MCGIKYNIDTKTVRIVQKWYNIWRCNMQFLMYPTTIKMLASEIISACDAYVSRKITAEHLKKVIWQFAEHSPNMLFSADNLNPTVLNRIGKKRAVLINKLLEGYQQRLLID